MIALFARILVKPDCVDRFLRYLEADVKGSLEEPGCLRFDVLRDPGSPNTFYLYEVYEDDEAYERHKVTPYFLAMFAKAGDTLAAPPEGYRGSAVLPSDPAYWRKQSGGQGR
jgi:autoinducer 2-degrading protein